MGRVQHELSGGMIRQGFGAPWGWTQLQCDPPLQWACSMSMPLRGSVVESAVSQLAVQVADSSELGCAIKLGLDGAEDAGRGS